MINFLYVELVALLGLVMFFLGSVVREHYKKMRRIRRQLQAHYISALAQVLIKIHCPNKQCWTHIFRLKYLEDYLDGHVIRLPLPEETLLVKCEKPLLIKCIKF